MLVSGQSLVRLYLDRENQSNLFRYDLDAGLIAHMTDAERGTRLAQAGRANSTADGKYVCVMLMEDQPEEKPSISFSHSRFCEFFHLKPLTQIAGIEVATGEMEIIHEDRRYIGPVNTSPAVPDILTYCHEGP